MVLSGVVGLLHVDLFAADLLLIARRSNDAVYAKDSPRPQSCAFIQAMVRISLRNT